MNKRAKKGLALMLLGAAYFSNVYASNCFSQGYEPSSKPAEPNQTYPINHREDGGFGALELAVVGLASVYLLRRVLRNKPQQ